MPGARWLPFALALGAGATYSAAPEEARGAGAGRIETIQVTARYRSEDAFEVPISLSVLGGDELDDTNTYGLLQLQQRVPSINYSSPNPRNTALTIRGLGSSVVAVAQANDGLEPGVGFYVDQVYHARPATAAFDLLDLERVEILRGPQGTLFGKNTTAGAMNIVTRAPDFEPDVRGEITGGNYEFAQAKLSLNGPLVDDRLAGRLSFMTTERDGMLDNVTTDAHNNDVDSAAVRGQLFYEGTRNWTLRLIGDHARVDTNCCTQVHYRVGTTLKAPDRQYPAMAAGKNYLPPSFDPYDRETDIDMPLSVKSHEGGVVAIADLDRGDYVLTSVSAWRYWKWDAANDRDYMGLTVQTVQGIPSHQDQYSLEFRIASAGNRSLDYVAGLYGFTQTIEAMPATEYGPDAAYWLLGAEPATPANLLDGYRLDGETRFRSDSYAAFGELTWHPTDALDLTAGVRQTWENKYGRYQATVSGGLDTLDPNLVRQKLSILRPQQYTADDTDGSASGRVAAAWRWTDVTMLYATWSLGFKSGGINMSGVPLNATGLPAFETAVIDPEENRTLEVGVKTRLFAERLVLNFDVFHTVVQDYQANVVDTGPGTLRGYLANVDEVRVKGAEFDTAFEFSERFATWLAGAWIDGEYQSYANGPCPLELIGSTLAVCDLSGKPLPTLPRWNLSAGREYRIAVTMAGVAGQAFVRADYTLRADAFGEASDSRYAEIDGYGILNTVIGFRSDGPWEVSVWGRNLTDEEYLQNVTIQSGNSGLVLGTPGDPLTFGVTLRAGF
jgi:iron complex outermembrane receptor protein